ncbi:MAG: ParB/RepB/Spo0J family partition protein [Bacteroidales bacterium]|nr:ParB/RepB/Spo0J family partition protein [Bacteroidales bacterium]
MSKKTGLGKGLSALLGDVDSTSYATPAVNSVTLSDNHNPAVATFIPIEQIEPNPYQPRVTFDSEALDELASSIKSIGLIQPITVRQIAPNKYQIISGERRYRASKIAGLKSVPIYLHKVDDRNMLEMAIVENIQREDLDAIETALSFQRLIDECNLTQEEMAFRVGKKRSSITNYLRLLKLPAEVQKLVKIGAISMGHAKVLLGVTEESSLLPLCELIISNDLSVRQLEEKVASLGKSHEKREKKEVSYPESYHKVAEIVGKYFNNNVSLKRNDKGKGSITIQFKNDSEVENFLQALENSKL